MQLAVVVLMRLPLQTHEPARLPSAVSRYVGSPFGPVAASISSPVTNSAFFFAVTPSSSR